MRLDDLHIIPQSLADIHHRLENWARWNKAGRSKDDPRGHCGSIEHKFAAMVLNEDNEAERRTAKDLLDVADATHLEVKVLLPMRRSPLKKYADVLELYYFERAHPGRMARLLGMHWTVLGDFRNRALAMVRNRDR